MLLDVRELESVSALGPGGSPGPAPSAPRPALASSPCPCALGFRSFLLVLFGEEVRRASSCSWTRLPGDASFHCGCGDARSLSSLLCKLGPDGAGRSPGAERERGLTPPREPRPVPSRGGAGASLPWAAPPIPWLLAKDCNQGAGGRPVPGVSCLGR